MKSQVRVAAVALLLAAGIGCQPMQEATSGADVDAIRAVSAAELGSLVAGDLEAHMATLAEDCIVMGPNEPAQMGHEAVAASQAAAMEMFDIEAEYTSSEIVVLGDWAIETYTGTGTFTPKDGSEGMTDTFKGIHVYKRQADGTWKIAQDIWNMDAPVSGEDM